VDEKSTWSPTWQVVDKGAWSTGIFNIFFNRIDFRTEFRADSRTDKHHQIILLKLINFETYYIKSNPPLFSANKVCNGPTTWSILTSHYA